jgi:uncharacterized protein YjbJ (UPF0337 family)
VPESPPVAAGVLTGDKKLKREGKVDQAVGKIKQKVEKVIDKGQRCAQLNPGLN